MSRVSSFGLPGIDARVSGSDAQVWWGERSSLKYANYAGIKSTTVDAGNTPTTSLRAGLILGKITATGLYTQYSPTASDGSEIAVAVLEAPLNMLDWTGTAQTRTPPILIGGGLKAASLVGLDLNARAQMAYRFLFDDDYSQRPAFLNHPLHEVAQTANYQLLVTDSGSLQTTTGAAGEVDFTLPAIAAGLYFEFLNVVDQVMKVISTEGTNMVWDNSVGISSLAFSTASHKIGGHLAVFANAAGTKWYVRQLGPSTSTVTAA